MARIGIDARFYGSIGKGLGRYTQKLIGNLEKIDSENQYFIFLRAENFDEYHPKNANFQKVRADYGWYTFSEQLRMPHLLKRYHLDLMHFPHFNVPLLYRKKFVITVHDLILLHFPTLRATTLNPLYYWIKFLAYRAVIFSAIHRSCGIITVSNFTKNDILKHYSIAESKITITYEACEDHPCAKLGGADSVLKKYGILKPYILYVGNAYPHKNLERLVSSLQLMKKTKPDMKLVLVGKHDYFYGALQKFAENKKIADVIFPGYVPDEEMSEVYKNADTYVFPSLYEGFGLPPLEAMAMGTPVVSSDHECMREILGDSALFIDAKSEHAIADGVLRVIQDVDLRQQLVLGGYQCISKYSWQRMAQDTLGKYVKNIHKNTCRKTE